MKLDITLKKVFTEIKEEIKEEEDVDISIIEIAEIVKSQFLAVLVGINYDVGTRLPYFGKFFMKANMSSGKAGQELNNIRAEIGEEEYKRRVFEAKMRNKANTKKAAKERLRKLTLEELLEQNNRDVLHTRFNSALITYKHERQQ